MHTNVKKADKRPVCKYDDKCYQKNPFHHAQYRHTKPVKRLQKGNNVDTDNKKKPKLEDNLLKDGESSTSQTSLNNSPDRHNRHTSKENNLDFNYSVKEELIQLIKCKFLIDLPIDFYQFWKLCLKLNSNEPLNAFKEANLTLVGPFEVLAGKIKSETNITDDAFLTHWRYYYDPPEMQTILIGNARTGFHIGYFRDDPQEKPVFLVSNASELNCNLQKMGDNIFAAVYLYLCDFKLSADPFKKLNIEKLVSLVKNEAEYLKFGLDKKTDKMRERDSKIVCRTFNKLGLVVPYNRKTQVGYRGLTMEDKELRQLLQKILKCPPEQLPTLRESLQPVLTYASIATDECDFGTGIELGWNILSSGVDSLNHTIATFLSTSYNLLGRQDFSRIIKEHMNNRRKGTDLSVI